MPIGEALCKLEMHQLPFLLEGETQDPFSFKHSLQRGKSVSDSQFSHYRIPQDVYGACIPSPTHFFYETRRISYGLSSSGCVREDITARYLFQCLDFSTDCLLPKLDPVAC